MKEEHNNTMLKVYERLSTIGVYVTLAMAPIFLVLILINPFHFEQSTRAIAGGVMGMTAYLTLLFINFQDHQKRKIDRYKEQGKCNCPYHRQT